MLFIVRVCKCGNEYGRVCWMFIECSSFNTINTVFVTGQCWLRSIDRNAYLSPDSPLGLNAVPTTRKSQRDWPYKKKRFSCTTLTPCGHRHSLFRPPHIWPRLLHAIILNQCSKWAVTQSTEGGWMLITADYGWDYIFILFSFLFLMLCFDDTVLFLVFTCVGDNSTTGYSLM